LGAMGVITRSEEYLFVGELSLDGSVRPVRGVLSMAVAARRKGIRNLIVPMENAAEAAIAEGLTCTGRAICRKPCLCCGSRISSSLSLPYL